MDVNLESTSDLSSFNSDIFVLNPIIITIVGIVIILYFVIFSSLGSNNSESNIMNTQNTSGKIGLIILHTLLWGIFIILILLNAMYYLFDIDIVTSMKQLFTNKAEIDIYVEPDKTNDKINDNIDIGPQNEVYHIKDNKYTYDDAKAICKASGGRLANYKEMEDAYKNGADWCGYGWSDDQLALFPTQYEKWFNLQKIENHKHDCGRPGINGGYIKNKNVKFGANCYGVKPDITQKERITMRNAYEYPLTQEDIEFNNRVKYWKNNLSMVSYSPFNHNKWNM